MKILLTGAYGQLGRALVATAPAGASIIAHDVDTLDITDAAAVSAAVATAKPDFIFNAAAYTAVDKAESDVAAATAVNETAVGLLAGAARDCGAKLVHVSTDFVFDGQGSSPYRPDAPTAPLGVYGETKRAGERAAGEDALIVRTAWVYAPTGANFVFTMLRLMAAHPQIRVVADQIGTPTYAPALAQALWTMAAAGTTGIHHYTDSGVASWYDFAVAIGEEAFARGLIDRITPVQPIATADYPTPARRPSYSVLDTATTRAVLGAAPPHWRAQLRVMLDTVAVERGAAAGR